MSRIITGALFLLLAVAVAAPALAWKGELRRGVVPIAEALEKAEVGDFVVVEGVIRRTGKAHGGRLVVYIDDETGEVGLLVPNHLRRTFSGGGPTGGSGPGGQRPTLGIRVRVAGKWDQAKLGGFQQGIRVQQAEVVAED